MMHSMIEGHFDFVHVFYNDSIGFNQNVIDIVHDCEDYGPSNHLFVTRNQELFENNQSSCNIVLMKDDELCGINLINSYGLKGDWIIAHGLPSPQYSIKIDKKLVNRIIWRTWGTDVIVPFHYSSPLEILKHLNWIIHGDYKYVFTDLKASILWPRIAKKFYSIGVSGVRYDISIFSRI